MADPIAQDVTNEIPEIVYEDPRYKKEADVAQYGEADWNNAVGIARCVTLREAKKIADQNPNITYFFYTKGGQMVLGTSDGNIRVFRYGDAVFFTGEPWWGTAPGLADGYIKR